MYCILRHLEPHIVLPSARHYLHHGRTCLGHASRDDTKLERMRTFRTTDSKHHTLGGGGCPKFVFSTPSFPRHCTSVQNKHKAKLYHKHSSTADAGELAGCFCAFQLAPSTCHGMDVKINTSTVSQLGAWSTRQALQGKISQKAKLLAGPQKKDAESCSMEKQAFEEAEGQR